MSSKCLIVFPTEGRNMAGLLSQINNGDGVLPSSYHLSSFERDPLPYPPPASPSPGSKISPSILFIIAIVAVMFFLAGLLHLLLRLLIKKHPHSSSSSTNGQRAAEIPGSEALQRQLQQLFHLHDAGLDQAIIDTLPVFLYEEIVGPKEPFDCAVCLCEFAPEDKLRLLPACGHAFHISCIDTWLLSNSTCPLCRGALLVPGLAVENPVFDFEDGREQQLFPGDCEDQLVLPVQKTMEMEEIVAEKQVLPVRLGKFRILNERVDDDNGNCNATGTLSREEGESSSSNLNARRCFSMGYYQYVLGEVHLQVAVLKRNGDDARISARAIRISSCTDEDVEGKRICVPNKGESFSMSKIWQWPNMKGKFPIVSSDSPPLARDFHGTEANGGDS